MADDIKMTTGRLMSGSGVIGTSYANSMLISSTVQMYQTNLYDGSLQLPQVDLVETEEVSKMNRLKELLAEDGSNIDALLDKLEKKDNSIATTIKNKDKERKLIY